MLNHKIQETSHSKAVNPARQSRLQKFGVAEMETKAGCKGKTIANKFLIYLTC